MKVYYGCLLSIALIGAMNTLGLPRSRGATAIALIVFYMIGLVTLLRQD
jgi:hypothetical protein